MKGTDIYMTVYALCLHYDSGGLTNDAQVISLHSTKEKAYSAGRILQKSAQEKWERHHEPHQLRPMFTGMYAGEYGSYYVKTFEVE